MKRKIEKDLMFIIESEIRTDLCIYYLSRYNDMGEYYLTEVELIN